MEFKVFLENTPPGKNKLAVYDFDGTLIFTPEPKHGIPKYEMLTGKEWGRPEWHWWDRKVSLTPPVFEPNDNHVNWKVVEQFHKDKANTETYTVIMTGRKILLAEEVKKILDAFDLYPDEYFFRHQEDLMNSEGYPSHETFAYKAFVIKKRLMNPNIKELTIYEDRPEHIDRFIKLGEQLKLRWPTLEVVKVEDAAK